MPDPRRPLAAMQSRDERVTVRYTSAELDRLRAGAARRGEEVSRYIRRTSLVGDSVLQSVPA